MQLARNETRNSFGVFVTNKWDEAVTLNSFRVMLPWENPINPWIPYVVGVGHPKTIHRFMFCEGTQYAPEGVKLITMDFGQADCSGNYDGHLIMQPATRTSTTQLSRTVNNTTVFREATNPLNIDNYELSNGTLKVVVKWESSQENQELNKTSTKCYVIFESQSPENN